MRFCSQCVLFALLFCLAALPSTAQLKPQPKHGRATKPSRVTRDATEPRSEPHSELRALTLDEGLAIISAALDSRHHAAFKTDCTHFVHGLYERAGFHYPYAPSADLYAGVDEFERVTNPQPGDLAVWHGHAGIVINPAQHSFFSLLRSGAGVASYDSAYWKKKGRPRFFRYVREVPYNEFSGSNWTASR